MTIKASLFFGGAKERPGIQAHRTHRSLKNRRFFNRGQLLKKDRERESYRASQEKLRQAARSIVRTEAINSLEIGTLELE